MRKWKYMILFLVCFMTGTISVEAAPFTNGACGENTNWVALGDGTFIVGGTGEMYDYSWRNYHSEYRVGWSSGLVNEIIIGDGVTKIGSYTFDHCTNVNGIYIPESVKEIKGSAFDGANKPTIFCVENSYAHQYAMEAGHQYVLVTGEPTVMKNLTAQGACGTEARWMLTEDGYLIIAGTGDTNQWGTGEERAPWYPYADSIKEAIILEGITKVGDYAFYDCSNMKTLTIPASVTELGTGMLVGCSSLKIYCKYGTAAHDYALDSGFSYWVDTTGTSTNVKYSGECGNYANWSLTDHGTLTISGIGDVEMPSRGYPDWMDYRDTIKRIVIEEGITSIPNKFFDDCFNLEEVTLAESLTSIGKETFYYCLSLKEVSVPGSITDIGERAFGYCVNMEKIEFPENLQTIGEYAFEGCRSLKEIEIPNGIKSIGKEAFLKCAGLETVILPEGMPEYGGNVFYGCGFEEITIPEGLTTLPDGFFWNCFNLKKIHNLDRVTALGNEVFAYCHGLETFEFPASITATGKDVFEGCKNLNSVTMNRNMEGLYVGMFYNCSALEKVNFYEGISYIGHYEFYGCTGLKELFLPEGVKDIFGNNCFYKCENLEKIYIPPSVDVISDSAFAGCDKLVIYCVEYTPAHTYAKRHGIPYELIKVYTDSAVVTECFPDVYHGEWYVPYIQYVYENGLMKGNKGEFLTNDAMTRSMVVQTLYNLEGKPQVTDFSAATVMKDVYPAQWDGNAICWAYNEGITTGNLDTMTFNGNDPVTREQLATLLYRYAEVKGYDRSQSDDLSELKNAWKVSFYAEDAVKWAVGAGLISGKDIYENGVVIARDLDPQGNATRAQMAAILMRFCQAFDGTGGNLIPEGAFEWNGHSYAIFDNCQSWEAAKAYCESRGGHLATITSAEENAALDAFMKESGYESAYFGLSDSAKEGSWAWVTGEVVDYTNWNPMEPSGGADEDYAMFFYVYGDGSWNDGAFSENVYDGGNAYICEWEHLLPPTAFGL